MKERPDGKISLPLIGDIQAAELTVVQLKDRLTERLKDYYKEPPQVSVIVQEINSYAIYVLGEVRSPGRYVVKTGTTFLQVLTLAGGFTDFAATKRIMVRRRGVGGSEETALSFRYKDIIGGAQSNILMKPGDTVIIPLVLRTAHKGSKTGGGAGRAVLSTPLVWGSVLSLVGNDCGENRRRKSQEITRE